jgi:hypothetical protein
VPGNLFLRRLTVLDSISVCPDFMRTDDGGDIVRLTPAACNVRTESDTDTLEQHEADELERG